LAYDRYGSDSIELAKAPRPFTSAMAPTASVRRITMNRRLVPKPAVKNRWSWISLKNALISMHPISVEYW